MSSRPHHDVVVDPGDEDDHLLLEHVVDDDPGGLVGQGHVVESGEPDHRPLHHAGVYDEGGDGHDVDSGGGKKERRRVSPAKGWCKKSSSQPVVWNLLPELYVEPLHETPDGELGGDEGEHVGEAAVAGHAAQGDDGPGLHLAKAGEKCAEHPELPVQVRVDHLFHLCQSMTKEMGQSREIPSVFGLLPERRCSCAGAGPS